jgi:hypothetical protein
MDISILPEKEESVFIKISSVPIFSGISNWSKRPKSGSIRRELSFMVLRRTRLYVESSQYVRRLMMEAGYHGSGMTVFAFRYSHPRLFNLDI